MRQSIPLSIARIQTVLARSPGPRTVKSPCAVEPSACRHRSGWAGLPYCQSRTNGIAGSRSAWIARRRPCEAREACNHLRGDRAGPPRSGASSLAAGRMQLAAAAGHDSLRRPVPSRPSVRASCAPTGCSDSARASNLWSDGKGWTVQARLSGNSGPRRWTDSGWLSWPGRWPGRRRESPSPLAAARGGRKRGHRPLQLHRASRPRRDVGGRPAAGRLGAGPPAAAAAADSSADPRWHRPETRVPPWRHGLGPDWHEGGL